MELPKPVPSHRVLACILRGDSEEFNAHYGVSFSRQWFNTSTSLMNALQHGEIDATEPYMTIDSFHNGKEELFDVSCITAGYDSTFFTKKSAPEVEIKILKDNELGRAPSWHRCNKRRCRDRRCRHRIYDSPRKRQAAVSTPRYARRQT